MLLGVTVVAAAALLAHLTDARSHLDYHRPYHLKSLSHVRLIIDGGAMSTTTESPQVEEFTFATPHGCPRNEVWDVCGDLCRATCEQSTLACPNVCLIDGACKCQPGWLRASATNSTCVPAERCPRDMHGCAANEEFRPCGTCCEPTCAEPAFGRTCQCGGCSSTGACQCKAGFFRRQSDAECVPLEQCPSNDCHSIVCLAGDVCQFERGPSTTIPKPECHPSPCQNVQCSEGNHCEVSSIFGTAICVAASSAATATTAASSSSSSTASSSSSLASTPMTTTAETSFPQEPDVVYDVNALSIPEPTVEEDRRQDNSEQHVEDRIDDGTLLSEIIHLQQATAALEDAEPPRLESANVIDRKQRDHHHHHRHHKKHAKRRHHKKSHKKTKRAPCREKTSIDHIASVQKGLLGSVGGSSSSKDSSPSSYEVWEGGPCGEVVKAHQNGASSSSSSKEEEVLHAPIVAVDLLAPSTRHNDNSAKVRTPPRKARSSSSAEKAERASVQIEIFASLSSDESDDSKNVSDSSQKKRKVDQKKRKRTKKNGKAKKEKNRKKHASESAASKKISSSASSSSASSTKKRRSSSSDTSSFNPAEEFGRGQRPVAAP